MSAALALAAWGFGDANDRAWRNGATGVFSAARATPLIFGLGLLLLRAPPDELRLRAFPLAALACPLLTPVPGWLRVHLNPSLISAWGAGQALRLAQYQVERRGVVLVLPRSDLTVDSECSGLGAVLQMLALVVMLGVVTRAPARRIAPLAGAAVALALLVNFVRLAVLAGLLEGGNFDGFAFWHSGRGSLVYSAISAALLLAVGLPLTAGRSRASATP